MLLNPAEKRALAQLAEFEGGLSLGAMIRHLIRDQAREHGLWQPAAAVNGSGDDKANMK